MWRGVLVGERGGVRKNGRGGGDGGFGGIWGVVGWGIWMELLFFSCMYCT